VALVGPSGAGKTTIADLIPRFYDVEKGCVMVDGKNVKSISKEDLRNAVSVVSQDTFLFNESIMDNIRVGCPGASDEAVYEAARHAFAHDFILEMDDGYQTVVGERGTRLSGGQKQRISIARAFLKNAPILILDEATSSLDSESEKKIQTALETLVKDKTVFMIAHRFATIKMADTIVVMQDGLVHGMGSHSELYEANDLYTALYDRQFID
jgi:ABC-type multidrug transport system fused ATPase/permease subunit